MDTKEINHIAKLARLKFDEGSVEGITKDMNDILKWMDILQSADTSSVDNNEDDTQELRQREDVVKVSNLSEDLMKNAPECYEHYFTVPKVVE